MSHRASPPSSMTASWVASGRTPWLDEVEDIFVLYPEIVVREVCEGRQRLSWRQKLRPHYSEIAEALDAAYVPWRRILDREVNKAETKKLTKDTAKSEMAEAESAA